LIFVGLTGGIGSGKSEALAACERLGAAVLSSDTVVHELLGTAELKAMLRDRWGEKVVASDGIDRGAVADIVFEHPDELAWLEASLFPKVGERIVEWREEVILDGVEVAVVEVPLLFEAGTEALFDATIAVVTDEALRAARTGTRDHRGVSGREGRQLSQEDKARRADYVVRNDGTLEELERSMAEVLEAIRRKAPA
jgi:dephospho-CoA kinase